MAAFKKREQRTHESQPQGTRLQRGVSFEEEYGQYTFQVDRALKDKFDQLIRQTRRSKTDLINEAVADLLRKYWAI